MSLRDDLRTLADRPLDRGQRGLLAGALLVLVAVAAGTLLLGRANGDTQPGRPVTPPAPPAGTPEPADPASENELLIPPPPPEDVPLPDELAAQRPPRLTAESRQAAERAGRRFTRDFLRFQARELDPQQIAAATGELRAWIAELPRGRGTPAVGENPARLIGVQAEASDAGSAVVTATVERLGARYPMRMNAREVAGGRWLVSALQSDPAAG